MRLVCSDDTGPTYTCNVLANGDEVGSQSLRAVVADTAAQTAEDSAPVTVEKFDPDAAPVLTLAVSANKPIRDITEYADKTLRRQLESVSGVGQVVVIGGRQRQINI